MNALEKAVTWKGETWVERAESCVTFLAVHGLLSDSEKAKVRRRLRKWFEKACAERGVVPA